MNKKKLLFLLQTFYSCVCLYMCVCVCVILRLQIISQINSFVSKAFLLFLFLFLWKLFWKSICASFFLPSTLHYLFLTLSSLCILFKNPNKMKTLMVKSFRSNIKNPSFTHLFLKFFFSFSSSLVAVACGAFVCCELFYLSNLNVLYALKINKTLGIGTRVYW